MKKHNLILPMFLVLTLVQFVFADYKISQKTTMEGVSFENTIYAKGVRKRSESKMTVGSNNEEAEMMAQMMPNFTKISQCDLKQDVTLSDRKRAFFIDYYDWSGLSPEQRVRRPNQKVVIKGTSTISSVVTDSGRKQMMFGLPARWLKHVTTIVNSPDSCDGKADVMMEEEGWFVNLQLASDTCEIPRIPGSKGGCRPKLILKAMQNPGFLLTGTMKMYENGKVSMTTNIETTALSKATLDQALFEIPAAYKEVDSESELMPGVNEMMDTTAMTQIGDSSKKSNLKTVAIDYFAGNASKINQDELRGYISNKLSDAGFSGALINSQADLLTGNYVNVIGVELKKVKESGGAKIGGLFGKVTGSDSAAKLGDSEAEIVITIYGKDGKTVAATASANKKVPGKANDAVKAAIDEIIGGLLQKIK